MSIVFILSRPEFVPMVMERVASEFNKLQYNVKLTDHPVVEASTPVSRNTSAKIV